MQHLYILCCHDVFSYVSIVADLYVVGGKANLSPRAVKQVEKRKRTSGKQEESTVDGSLVAVTAPVSSPNAKSPSKGE